jgi:predicted hydrolase (HD superfamily)
VIRPNKIADMEVSSVKKKLKDKAFARAVSREDITNGAADLGVPLDEHIGFVIAAMKERSALLGL